MGTVEREPVRGRSRQMVMGRQVATVGAIACMLAIVGCASSLEPRPPDGPGVTGRMILLDDIGRPPIPDRGGGIVVIPESALVDLWRGVGREELDDLAYTSFAVDADMVADPRWGDRAGR
jgi:hypothetical protein